MEEKKSLTVKRCKVRSAPEKCGVRYFKNTPRGVLSIHRHDFIELEYICEGEIGHELNGVGSVLGVGGCYCLDRMDQHSLTVPSGVTIHNLCITYKNAPEAVQRLLGRVKLPVVGCIAPEGREKMNEWFARLGALLSGEDEYAEERITALLLLILSAVFEVSETVTEKPSAGGYKHIARAIDHIYEHYGERLLLPDVARAVYLSPNHFSKLFCEVTGIPFSDYLTRLRIERACEALREGDRSVTDIAMECGFSSFSTFSRGFKRICGCTPTEYRIANSV